MLENDNLPVFGAQFEKRLPDLLLEVFLQGILLRIYRFNGDAVPSLLFDHLVD